MPNFSARIEHQRVVDVTFFFDVSILAADGASYIVQIEIPSASLGGNITNYNQTIKDAISAKLLSDYGVTLGAGNKIVLMGGGV